MALRNTSAATGTFFVFDANSIQVERVDAGYSFSTNTWYQLVGVMAGTNLYLYVNGVQIGSSALSGSIGNGGASLKIGAKGNFENNWLNGFEPNVQLYNTSLSSTEIQGLYAEGIGGAPAEPCRVVAPQRQQQERRAYRNYIFEQLDERVRLTLSGN